MHPNRFTVIVAKENGGYRATCPALPGCRAYGDTKKESLRNIEIAITFRLEVLAKQGKPAPREKEPV